MTVIDLAGLKTYMEITGSDDDANLTTIVNSVNAIIKRETGRVFGDTATVTDEEHDYEPVIFLDNMDITSITTVKSGRGASPTTLDADTYFHNESGRLTLATNKADYVNNVDDQNMIRVTYEHGVATARMI
jgi:hypothetical protein